MKRNKNKKIVLASTIVLGIAAITSSALAAYIITGGATKGEANVKPSTVEIDNRVVDLTVGVVSGTLLFEPDDPVGEGAITTDGDGNRTVTIPLTVKAKDEESIPDYNVEVTQKGGDVTNVNYGDVTNANFIVLPEATRVTSEDFTSGNTETGFTCNLELTWNWGSAFGETDPAAFYNPKIEAKSVNVTDVLATLNAFAAAVNATTFVVTITQVDAGAGA